jgi:anti-sigma B factor antagonist
VDIEVTKSGNAQVVVLTGRLDSITVKQLETKLDDLITGGAVYMVFDFSALEYISSAGLRAVLSTAKRLKAGQGSLLMSNLNGMVKEVFQVAGFLELFPIYASTDEALAAIP